MQRRRTSRATNPQWYESLGLFASADAINAGVSTAAETQTIISRVMNDSVTICGLSNFNTFFVLEALAAASDLDRAYGIIHRCWDVMVLLEATTTWETSQPDWLTFLRPTDGLPGFEDGFTSMAHPRSSGATAWASKWLVGVRALSPGYKTFVVAPHVAGTMTGIRGSVPTPVGPIHVEVENQRISVTTPQGLDQGTLKISARLAQRALGGNAADMKTVRLKVHGHDEILVLSLPAEVSLHMGGLTVVEFVTVPSPKEKNHSLYYPQDPPPSPFPSPLTYAAQFV